MHNENQEKKAVIDKYKIPEELTKEKLIEAYETMKTSALLDRKMAILIKQGKSFFHIGCRGHEAIQVATAFAASREKDWFFPYYRDQALCLGLGVTARECMMAFLGKKNDIFSGGRQLPQHYSSIKHNIATSSSSTGTQYLHAVGSALASIVDLERTRNEATSYSVSVVSSGEGATSQGDFHEALNWATLKKAPVIFLIQNNRYAISVPIKDQRMGEKIASLGLGYEGLFVKEVDGCNFIESYITMKEAFRLAKEKYGPVLIDANVVRLLPHSSSDDHKKYRSEDDIIKDKERDPIEWMKSFLMENSFATVEEINEIDLRVLASIDEIASECLKESDPDASSSINFVFSEKNEPRYVAPTIAAEAEEVVMVDAINRALREEMTLNEKILIYGEDVAGNKGGVFTVTRNITKDFGENRCFNSPLAESSIVGTAIGLAFRGYKPVVEIQFADYAWTAMMQIRNELSTIRYRSNGVFSSPMVIRMPVGGYIHGGLCHSQNIEATFAHFPGLKIAIPSNALDAYGLLKSAIRGNDPVLFLEPKALYRQNHAKCLLPVDDNWLLPFGKCAIKRVGEDLTIVTYGNLVQRAIEASRVLEKENISVEVLDLRTIVPCDFDSIKESVIKTGKVIVLHEDTRFMGFGAEICADIAERCYEHLDGPVRRLAAKDSPIPYSTSLELNVLPGVENILQLARDLAAY